MRESLAKTLLETLTLASLRKYPSDISIQKMNRLKNEILDICVRNDCLGVGEIERQLKDFGESEIRDFFSS